MIRVRTYGTSGPAVIVLHGGPAAVGQAAPIARGLADSFRVLEPSQRGSGEGPLSVARHVADLHEVVNAYPLAKPPALVGHSWGAMLALAYAAAHPDAAGPLVLVSCGTFDPAARARIQAVLEERMDDTLRRRLDRLSREVPLSDEQLKRRFELLEPLYMFDPVATEEEESNQVTFDARAFAETWDDMLRLQREGVYPAAFAAITSPVLMLHGAFDPHSGPMIRPSLAPYLPQLEYREWERCGHFPWRERAVRDAFFATLRSWLAQHL